MNWEENYEWQMGNDLEGGCHNLFEDSILTLAGNSGESYQTSVRRDRIPVGYRIKFFS